MYTRGTALACTARQVLLPGTEPQRAVIKHLLSKGLRSIKAMIPNPSSFCLNNKYFLKSLNFIKDQEKKYLGNNY